MKTLENDATLLEKATISIIYLRKFIYQKDSTIFNKRWIAP